jgi:predicted nucleotidyltransferase component of viral defense system
MIRPGEIQRIARGEGVRDQQIEKDYVLSWILNGIAHHDRLSGIMAFKGGTVLKKFYFVDYRYSEDLDFTLLEEQVSNDQIFSWFRETFEYIRNEANIPLEIIDNNEHEDGGINFYIGYIGPLGGLGSNKKVKVDISKSEKLEFKPVRKSAFLGYSDLEPHELLCYQLEEVLVEKLRSVMQRMQARDFYDIWFLLEEHSMDADFLINEFSNKCISKGLSAAEFYSKLEERMPQYKSRWKTTLSEQIHNLPDFEQVEREVTRHLKKLQRR